MSLIIVSIGLNLYLAYEYLLLYEQYDSSNVFVFYGDGNDYNTGHNRYRKELHNWGQITDFGYALYSLSTGKCPDGTTCNLNQYCLATALEDSLLSVNELHSGIVEFIVQNASYYQHPCIFDEGGISNKVFIGENKKLKDVFIGSNSSYWLDDMALSNVLFDNNLDISIDVDVKLEIKKNTFVPKGTTLIIK